jgi:hypothetical protein
MKECGVIGEICIILKESNFIAGNITLIFVLRVLEQRL